MEIARVAVVCGDLHHRPLRFLGVRMWPRDAGNPRSSEQQRKVDVMLRIGWSVVGVLAGFGLAFLH
jgi:hypothetical protein